ncbi:hypothetical protein F3Y22_tig00111398pilonHSYRG00045 [Hibiscus syriacus]|uniref:F-box domain-containing protein n=1 Tax=Hibiscus syriacus TaxID=106335 RepID=A0A6A2Y5L1_HIBSY|nr:putative F-box protein At3g29830 [Hibiscus syriacus]KAE8679510.1 hypothetical protein F3Y22_tig00111398pilonHSYRG00045 [Hibiscus syriacus]
MQCALRESLPDDVLVLIISCLPTKVAAKTSLLSRRWRSVWTLLPRLEFDASNTSSKIKNRTFGSTSISEFVASEKVRFVSVVNQVVESYPLPAIDEFKVCFDHDILHKHDIDKWVKFVFEKKAKRIELDFSRAKVAGPSLRLKYLEIYGCSRLKSLEVVATNLLTLKYCGPYINIPFENIPNLIELCIGKALTGKLQQILTFFPRLRKLQLDIGYVENTVRRLEYPLMNQLKQMEPRIYGDNMYRLLFLSSWIKACPSLHRFALDFEWGGCSYFKRFEKRQKSVHHNLKVVEISGFVGKIVDTELYMLLIEIAIVLEKIVITPTDI